MNLTDELVLLLLPLISFFITLLLTPEIIKKSYDENIVGVDVHKVDKRTVPNVGGLAIFIGFMGTLTVAGFLNLDEKIMLTIFLSASLGALIGLIDDIFTLSKRLLVVSTLLMGFPIIAFKSGITTIFLTPIGPVDLGVSFWLLVPIIFGFLTNSVNIYSIYNGLEAGLGFVTSLSLAVCALIYGSEESVVALLALAGSLLAFLKWNKFPAKIFPGNSGTYLIGAVLASSIIVGVIKLAGVIACFPYLINFVLRMRDKLRRAVGEVDQNGLVYSSKVNGLWAIFTHNKPRTEATTVRLCILFHAIFGFAAIVISYYHHNMLS